MGEIRLVLATALVLACAAPSAAQSPWTYRVRFAAETTATQPNGRSPLVSPLARGWQTQQLLVGSADAVWTSDDRLRIAGGFAASASHQDVSVRVRELYARASAAPWMDVEVGKRIVRWGVGYGFSPAGVLDPPRQATDPSDRLQLNEGRLLARGDLYKNDSSVTIAAGERVGAARLSTVTAGGVELAIIGFVETNRRPQYAATVTHVIGEQLEWHAEALVHEGAAERVVSGAAGVQYTFGTGVNVIVEYHRNGRGLNGAEWNDVLRGNRPAGSRPTRENFLFLRTARAAADVKIIPELIILVGLDDNGWTLLPSITWTPHAHLQAHLRVIRLTGARRSVAASAPFGTSVTAGASMRF